MFLPCTAGLVHFQWNQRPPKHPWFWQKSTFICLPSLSDLSDIMIWAMLESSAGFKTRISHATTRVTSDIAVKRPENHQGILSTRYNFNISEEWPIAISVVQKTLCTRWETTLVLTCCYIYHGAICRGKRLLAWRGFMARKYLIQSRKYVKAHENGTWIILISVTKKR